MSLLLAILSNTLVVAPPADDGAAQVEPADAKGFSNLVIHADGVDAEDLRDRLALRLSGREVVVYTRGVGTGPSTAVLQVRPVGEELALSLVLPDGGAYFRTTSVTPEQTERIVAATIANLVAAIEADQVRPDREGVSTREILSSAPADAPPLQRPQRAEEPAPAEPERTAEIVTPEQPEPPKAETSPEKPAPRSERVPELGVSLGPTVALGFPRPPAFRGIGGTAAFSVSLRSGAMLRLGVRGLGQRSGEYRLGRVRVDVGAGYDLRVRAFEMPVLVSLGVEPWWVAAATPSSPRGRPVPVLGAHLRLEPSARLRTPDDRLWLRLGLALGIGTSAELRQGVSTPVIRQTSTGPALFRIGGPEASAGIVFEVRFAVSK